MTTLVIQGGTLIDATGRPPLEDAVIVVQGERIKSVGKKNEVAFPKGSQVISVKGKTILPGFLDGHCHMYDFAGELFLHLGVTTAPDILENDDDWVLAQKDGTRKGKIRGPRMWAAGTRLVAPPPPWAMRGFVGHIITTPESYGIIVSPDNGKTWDSIKTGFDKITITSLAIFVK